MNEHCNSFLKPLIDDAVQVWHFFAIIRKYGKIISNDTKIKQYLIDRMNVVIEHMATATDASRLKEMIEDLDDDLVAPKPSPKVHNAEKARPSNRRTIEVKVSDLDDNKGQSIKKPYTIIRELYSTIVELDAKYQRLDNRVRELESSIFSTPRQ